MKNNKLILIAMCIGIFLCMLDTTIMNIALPQIQLEYNVDLSVLSWALNIYTILFAGLTISLSKIADRFGKERIYLFALLLFIGASFLCGISPNVVFLIAARALQSIGAAMLFPLSMVMGISTTTIEKRKNVVAALGVTQGFAAAIGPTLGGIITQYVGWSWVFFINIPIGLISLCLCTSQFKYTIKDKVIKSTEKIDYLGSILSMIALFTITVVLLKGNEFGWNSYVTIILIIVGIIATYMFVQWEKKHTNPMIPVELFKNQQYLITTVVVILSNLFLVGIMVTMPSMLTQVEGKTELIAALLITPISVMIFIFSPIAAISIKKISPVILISMGFVFMLIGYFILGNYETGNFKLVLAFCFIGTGYGIIAGPVTLLSASDFTGNLLTASQSVIGVMRQIGIVLAVAVYVSLLTLNISSAKNESINVANFKIDQSNLIEKAKEDMKKKVSESILSGKKSEKKESYISNETRENMINSIYETAISNKEIPNSAKKAIKEEIIKKVDIQIYESTAEINALSDEIQKITSNNIKNSFLSVYKILLPLLGIAIFPAFFFKKQRIK